MNTNINEDKKSANGKWASSVQPVQKGAERAGEMVEDVYNRAIDSGAKLASQASEKTLSLLKQYPVQAAVGGILTGLVLGATMFRRKN